MVTQTHITVELPVQVVGVLPIVNNTHAEPLTDGNANFIFAATLSVGGDIICVEGVTD